MGKLAQIKELVQKSEELVEEVYGDLVEEVAQYNEIVEKIEMARDQISLTTLPNLNEAFEGMEHLPQTPMEPEIEEEAESIKRIDIPQKYEIEEPKAGLFGAKLGGLLGFIGIGAAALIVGASMKGINLTNISEANWRKSLEDVFGFYSSLITQSPDSGEALGSVIVAASAIGGGYLVYLLLASSAASKNLDKAKEIYEDVKKWCEEQRSYIQKLRLLQSALKEAHYIIEGNRVFGDEFAARLKRVRFFDGNDYADLSGQAKEEVDSARMLFANLTALAKQKLYIQDFELLDHTKNLLDEAKQLMETIKGKIYG